MSFCLLTEVKQQWAMLVLGWVTTSGTIHVSDGFVARASRPKPLSALLLQYTVIVRSAKKSTEMIVILLLSYFIE